MNVHTTKLTLNWHFTPYCNMHCCYCFIPKTNSLSLTQQLSILDKLDCGIFDRINFVGGEPTISESLLPLLSQTVQRGLKASIVTNGYNMIHDPKYTEILLPYLSMIGLSVDSLVPTTNFKIGRTCNRKPITSDDYIALCTAIREAGKILKINTVVSKANIEEDFSRFYNEAAPDKIKLFQILAPNVSLKNHYNDLMISNREFKEFTQAYEYLSDKLFIEDNEMMTNSYVQLNSEGCFCDNLTGVISPSLLRKGMTIREAMSYISLDLTKYHNRYVSNCKSA